MASPPGLTGTVDYLDFSKYLNHVAQESEYKLRTQGSSYRRGFLLRNQATLCSLPGGVGGDGGWWEGREALLGQAFSLDFPGFITRSPGSA